MHAGKTGLLFMQLRFCIIMDMKHFYSIIYAGKYICISGAFLCMFLSFVYAQPGRTIIDAPKLPFSDGVMLDRHGGGKGKNIFIDVNEFTNINEFLKNTGVGIGGTIIITAHKQVKAAQMNKKLHIYPINAQISPETGSIYWGVPLPRKTDDKIVTVIGDAQFSLTGVGDPKSLFSTEIDEYTDLHLFKPIEPALAERRDKDDTKNRTSPLIGGGDIFGPYWHGGIHPINVHMYQHKTDEVKQ